MLFKSSLKLSLLDKSYKHSLNCHLYNLDTPTLPYFFFQCTYQLLTYNTIIFFYCVFLNIINSTKEVIYVFLPFLFTNVSQETVSVVGP